MRSLKFATALLLSLSAAPAMAQMPGLGAGPFPMGAALPDRTVPVIEYQPPARVEPVAKPLSSVIQGPTLFVYVLPEHAHSRTVALDAIAKAKTWKRVRLVVMIRGLNENEVGQAVRWISENEIQVPVVIDQSMGLAMGLGATQVPSFAMTDGDGRLRVRRVRSLDHMLQGGSTLADTVAAAERGGEIPLSDGEMPMDSRSLVGQKAPGGTVEPAFFAKDLKPVDLGQSPGKPRLLVFWMATCPHCQREMPRIHEWWQRNKDKVDLVTVTRLDMETVRTQTTRYLRERNLQAIPVYTADEGIWRGFRVEAIPTWVMLDAKGVVRHAHVGQDLQVIRSLDEAFKKAGGKP